MKAALVLLNVVPVLSLFISSAAVSQRLPDAIDRVRPSIVQVRSECSGGTAFLVNKEGFALTAAHVVACPAVALASHRIKVGLPLVYSVTEQTTNRANFKFIDADVIERDDVHDIALLKLSTNPFGAEIQSGYTLEGKSLPLMALGVPLLSARTLREGEPIAASGFPFTSPVLHTNAGIIASTRSAHYFDSEGDGVHVRVTSDFYLADMTVNHGNSGGPVYDFSGEVIGIVSAFKVTEVEQFVSNGWQQTQRDEGAYGYNARLAVIIPIAHAKALISKHAVNLPSK